MTVTLRDSKNWYKSNSTVMPSEQDANVRAMARAQLERLESDLRVLSPLGIERAAFGWDRHEADSAAELHASERTALHALEAASEGAEWDEWRRRLFYEVEGRQGLLAWRTEHQGHAPHVHKAERAALAAALGLVAQSRISHAHYRQLVSAMAEALPWLLPEQAPAEAH
jgi:hypothetical protein